MDIIWVEIDSWHVLQTDGFETLCGEKVTDDTPRADELGAGKSCENCLRILGRSVDEGEPVSA